MRTVTGPDPSVPRDERREFSESEDCVFLDFDRFAFLNAIDACVDTHIIE